MKNFLVTGGCGNLAVPLIKALIQQGHKVSTLDNYSRGRRDRLNGENVCFFYGDIRDIRFVRTAVKGHDIVIHMAAINGTENFYKYPSDVLEVGTKGIINVMDSCVEHGVKELLVFSSSEVYQDAPEFPTPESVPLIIPNPHNPRCSYGASKIISEVFALHYKMENFNRVMVVRPHNVFGPGLNSEHVIPQFIQRMMAKPETFVIEGMGYESRSFCYIDDMVDGILAILEKGVHREIYHIGAEEEVEMDILAIMVARQMSLEETKFTYTRGKEGSPIRRCPDTRKLQSLGWRPKVMLEEGLRRTIQWYQEQWRKQP